MTHYFKDDETLKSDRKKHLVIINDQEFSFISDHGVFSKKGLDFGTRSLLENLPLSKIKGNILDFGCGYGPIGIYLSKTLNIAVDMIDINNRSLELAKINSELNKVTTNIFFSDVYSNVTNKYDFIISNPPIRVGKQILYSILIGAKNYLKDSGELWIVINKDQGAKTVVKDLSNIYRVEVIAKNKGFYIICAKNN